MTSPLEVLRPCVECASRKVRVKQTIGRTMLGGGSNHHTFILLCDECGHEFKHTVWCEDWVGNLNWPRKQEAA